MSDPKEHHYVSSWFQKEFISGNWELYNKKTNTIHRKTFGEIKENCVVKNLNTIQTPKEKYDKCFERWLSKVEYELSSNYRKHIHKINGLGYFTNGLADNIEFYNYVRCLSEFLVTVNKKLYDVSKSAVLNTDFGVAIDVKSFTQFNRFLYISHILSEMKKYTMMRIITFSEPLMFFGNEVCVLTDICYMLPISRTCLILVSKVPMSNWPPEDILKFYYDSQDFVCGENVRWYLDNLNVKYSVAERVGDVKTLKPNKDLAVS